MNPFPDFPSFFRALWRSEGRQPFPWQTILAERVSSAPWPGVIDLPTAAGKTACLDIAVYALAAQAEARLGKGTAARRIWFVVDRRIVVDAAFERAQKLADTLANDATPAIRAVAERLIGLRGLPSRERPLAVGRLRGGVLRDDRWARIPSQCAIITSTVDQMGSRLLFRSYGNSSLAAPVYAGLAGNDSLILLDEAHCAAPFLQTLRAVQNFRSSKWSEAEPLTPFHATVLSATPPNENEEEPLDIFPAEAERDRALADERLQLRLRASKKATLEKVPSEEKLARRLAEAAVEFAGRGRRRIGVIVNRVARATAVAKTLREIAQKRGSHGEVPGFDVELLTGRIRPVERDLLVGKDAPLHRQLRSFDPEDRANSLILVATQCLEVGADFSFDALVTECASLDALRQRFGRLDRLGINRESHAFVLTAESQLIDSDPIYGEALMRTWEFLQSVAAVEDVGTKNERRVVDFGVNAAVSWLPASDNLRPLLAPASDAPILLPAHLDLFCQTAPLPDPDPDIGAFLHGKGRGTPEVRVCWRCDLDPALPELWPEVVSLCRPTGGEMLSVPLYRFRQWWSDRGSPDLTGDVEGEAEMDEGSDSPGARPGDRHFLIWRGREKSEVLSDPDYIRPGNIVVVPVPSDPSAAESLGQLRGEGVGGGQLDLWERAGRSTGQPVALRVSRDCLAPWLKETPWPLDDLLALVEGDEWDVAELREALRAVHAWKPDDDAAPRLPEWLRDLFGCVKECRSRDVSGHPGGGLIVRERPKSNADDEQDFFADDDDEPSKAPEEILLCDHTAIVERNASVLAKVCLGHETEAVFKNAARWHDAGKLDRRFQALLCGGIADPRKPLAKSPNLPRSRQRSREIAEASDLPKGFRHEMLSLQLAERFAIADLSPQDRDLVLHLIASHHGHARPFAPVVVDENPPGIDLSPVGHGGNILSPGESRSLTPPYQLDSGVSERFWTLTRRFGWWGLAYREAILRLADWYASANPEQGGQSS